ncbi:mRNA cleavage and polyadenylation specificity factor complex subunit pta1 [Lecanosticta acicola]|uniref:mRNA cleavage and polyadenylation specificity factor complex subunit pta1 n=1 Tax=Lecanosticta acicola TaxID=111012 RepID=A0AAI8Z402_9PEZI|nr:mRNA cleavage and polyadenylation specificity factor complex subunit pta1 [Lecanosticta acicola]
MASPTETLKSLNSARDIVLKDHTLYTQVVPGIIQVISPAAVLELRRWGADFLAETFASQAVTAEEKQSMAAGVLDTVKGYLSRKEVLGEDEDPTVVKSAVQCAASVYPFVFRHTIAEPKDTETWGKMAGIKSSILRRMDTADPGVRICCVKFVACVVQTQTPGLIADPRRPEQNEISLALVPRDHPVIPPSNLEAEASGLLDRLLGVLQDYPTDPLIVTALLNSLAPLAHRRATISSKILTAVISFNPMKLASRQMSGRDKIAIRSMTRTVMSFLMNCIKRNHNNAFSARIQQQLERLRHGLIEVFSDNHQHKRPAPDEPVDGLDDAKRQKLDAEATNGIAPLQQRPPTYPPLPPGPVSLAQLWTLTTDPHVSSFHAERLPASVLPQLVPALVSSLSHVQINDAINVVRSRWLHLGKQNSAAPLDSRPALSDEDDDDYDPLSSFGGEAEQTMNQLDQMPPNGVANDVAIGPFNLPTAPAITDQNRPDYNKASLSRIFDTVAEHDRDTKLKGRSASTEHGFNRLITVSTSGDGREAWLTLVTRLATRASFSPEGSNDMLKEEGKGGVVAKKGRAFDLPTGIREQLLNYVMENFRGRIDIAIMWLTEEWYSDVLSHKQRMNEEAEDQTRDLPHYWHWTLRLFDAMIPYFDVKDGRILIRFLSEIPAINSSVLQRVKKVAEDPERVQISANALLYLIMFRPPARDMALNCTEEMWRENKDAKTAAKKILIKYRSNVVEEEAKTEALKPET